MKIKKGDMVQVISGKDKGAQGKVIEAYPKRQRVLVEGVNRMKKHVANSYNERGAESWIPTASRPAWATVSTKTARRSALQSRTGRTSKHG